MSPEDAMAEVSPRTILLMNEEDDPVTPVEHALRLEAAAPAAGIQIELWILPGHRHTEGIRIAPDYTEPSPTRQVYLSKMIEFFRRSLH